MTTHYPVIILTGIERKILLLLCSNKRAKEIALQLNGVYLFFHFTQT